MAWTPPRTWSPGETVTASLMNTHLRDNFNVVAGCFVKGGVFMSPAAGAWANVWWADHNATVTTVKGFRVGGTAATFNARICRPQQASTKVFQVTASGPTYTDLTTAAGNSTANDVTAFNNNVVGDWFGVCYSAKFHKLRIQLGTAGTTAGTLTWEYWNGSTWATISGFVDATGNLRNAAGWYECTFVPPSDWASTTVNGTAGYWIRARLSSGTYTVKPLITQMWLVPGGYLLSADAATTNPEEWNDGGSVQNTGIVAGDGLEILAPTPAGSPTQVGVQVQMTLAT